MTRRVCRPRLSRELEPPVGVGFPEDIVNLIAEERQPAPSLPEDPDQRVLNRTAVLVHHAAGRDQRRTGDDDVAEIGLTGMGRARKAKRRGRSDAHPRRPGDRYPGSPAGARSSSDHPRRVEAKGEAPSGVGPGLRPALPERKSWDSSSGLREWMRSRSGPSPASQPSRDDQGRTAAHERDRNLHPSACGDGTVALTVRSAGSFGAHGRRDPAETDLGEVHSPARGNCFQLVDFARKRIRALHIRDELGADGGRILEWRPVRLSRARRGRRRSGAGRA